MKKFLKFIHDLVTGNLDCEHGWHNWKITWTRYEQAHYIQWYHEEHFCKDCGLNIRTKTWNYDSYGVLTDKQEYDTQGNLIKEWRKTNG